MQWSLQFVLMFFLFSKCKDSQNEIESKSLWTDKAGKIARAFSDTVK